MFGMPRIQFPTDHIVGTVEWDGSWTDERGPVLATGSVQVPEGVGVSLHIRPLRGSEPKRGGSWTMIPAQSPIHVGFVRDLPPDVIESVLVRSADEGSFDAVTHLAPGLRRLYLGRTGFSDAVLPTVAKLSGLTYLQTFGNNFTDQGVQQLGSLVHLEHLYLEEETLTLAAFDFVERLPHLTRVGLQCVPLSQRDVEQVRERLPGVDGG
jgi:hypothetical protein